MEQAPPAGTLLSAHGSRTVHLSGSPVSRIVISAISGISAEPGNDPAFELSPAAWPRRQQLIHQGRKNHVIPGSPVIAPLQMPSSRQEPGESLLLPRVSPHVLFYPRAIVVHPVLQVGPASGPDISCVVKHAFAHLEVCLGLAHHRNVKIQREHSGDAAGPSPSRQPRWRRR